MFAKEVSQGSDRIIRFDRRNSIRRNKAQVILKWKIPYERTAQVDFLIATVIQAITGSHHSPGTSFDKQTRRVERNWRSADVPRTLLDESSKFYSVRIQGSYENSAGTPPAVA